MSEKNIAGEVVVEAVFPDIYRIEVPLPNNPLRAVNCYVIKGDGRFLVIDTGQNRVECLNVLTAGLKKLNVDLNKTDFFITHLHVDHLGLVGTLATETSIVYFNQPDTDAVRAEYLDYWEKRIEFARMNGFPEDTLQKTMSNHPALKYRLKQLLDFHILKEGDTLSVGDYSFRCIETPGHTDGHICLYDSPKKLFISGDHVLSDITPNIQLWDNDGRNALEQYLASLDKVYPLDVELVLPGHRLPFTNFKGRIQELKQHHRTRANECLVILEKGSQVAFKVASQMTWDITYDSWATVPGAQKWFATGEALSHLKYLELEGKVRREVLPDKILFSLV